MIVVGGGVAGRSALENFPRFPAGVNARKLLDFSGEQVEADGNTATERSYGGSKQAEGEESAGVIDPSVTDLFRVILPVNE